MNALLIAAAIATIVSALVAVFKEWREWRLRLDSQKRQH